MRCTSFPDKIFDILQQQQLQPHHLCLELTESTDLEQDQRVLQTLTQLTEMGIQLQVDDFGIGYSSLSYLHHLPFSALKIDRSFIRRIDTEAQGLEMIKTIVNMAQALDMDIIAEGIETQSQLNQLLSLDCAYGQGYWYSPPISHRQAEFFVREYISHNHANKGALLHERRKGKTIPHLTLS
jgi:EAL domain-containing protein (putative c-di-GMP-specific phosphodiesterase class I)